MNREREGEEDKEKFYNEEKVAHIYEEKEKRKAINSDKKRNK